tara:strand:- start:60 stop:1016 length:957 start_codon:yes stop_codon:yes gene_type:complete
MGKYLHTVTGSLDVDQADDGLNMTVNRLIDVSAQLSQRFGRMIRQGQTFDLLGIDISARHADSGNDVGGAVSGLLNWYSPTKGRIAAWKKAFRTTQRLRKLSGIEGSSNRSAYDFRVGLINGYDTVRQNAEMLEDEPLYLHHSSDPKQSLFAAYNKAQDAEGVDIDGDIAEDVYGLVDGWDGMAWGNAPVGHDYFADDQEHALFVPGTAHTVLEYTGFSTAFGARSEDEAGLFQTMLGTAANVESGEAFPASPGVYDYMWRPLKPVPIMCGLIGLQPMSTMVDEAGVFTDDITIDYAVHIGGWSPFIKSKKSKKGRRK